MIICKYQGLIALLVASRIHYLKVPSSNPVGSPNFFSLHFCCTFKSKCYFFHLKYSMNIYFIMLDKKMNTFAIKTGKRTLWPRLNRKETTVYWGWFSIMVIWDLWSMPDNPVKVLSMFLEVLFILLSGHCD